MKKMLKILCAVFILMSSVMMIGCGSLKESDLPDESKKIVVEWEKNVGFIKPKGMPCTKRYDDAFKNADKIIDQLKPEYKEALLDQTCEVTNMQVHSPMNTSRGYIVVPISVGFKSYLKSAPDYAFQGRTNVLVIWKKVDGELLVDDIEANGKSHRDTLEGLEYNIGGLIESSLRMREKAGVYR